MVIFSKKYCLHIIPYNKMACNYFVCNLFVCSLFVCSLFVCSLFVCKVLDAAAVILIFNATNVLRQAASELDLYMKSVVSRLHGFSAGPK